MHFTQKGSDMEAVTGQDVISNDISRRTPEGEIENRLRLLMPRLLALPPRPPFFESEGESPVHTPVTGPLSERPFYWGEGHQPCERCIRSNGTSLIQLASLYQQQNDVA
jgi:hypothetical protein